MPFAWSARPVFRLYSNELDTISEFPAIYRQEGNRLRDEDLIKILTDYRKYVHIIISFLHVPNLCVCLDFVVYCITYYFCRPDKMSRLTVIPGWIKMHIEPLVDLPGS